MAPGPSMASPPYSVLAKGKEETQHQQQQQQQRFDISRLLICAHRRATCTVCFFGFPQLHVSYSEVNYVDTDFRFKTYTSVAFISGHV